MNCKSYLAASVASFTIALALAGPAQAQSTGSIDFNESDDIVVSGARANQDVGGIITPDTSKAKQVLTQEIIARQNPGQSILDTINLVPGVSFQNNDAYGSSGGTLTIRGFDSSRISLTFDGVPLNDSGNYAIYSNQQLDPELIEQVNVNLGTTDVDSPTASAVGGTVNYRTIVPSEEYGALLSASYGDFKFHRVFGKLETGAFGPFGTRAFISASKASNRSPFNNYGRVDKQQYNARIYQPLGTNGDFLSIAGNYNQNRNNFFGSLPLRNDPGRTVGVGSGNRFPANNNERRYQINFPCATDAPQAGVADTTNSCGTEFDRRFNPSNTGNVRGASRFSIMDGLVLTVDPSYQYVKANGGGTTTGFETACRLGANGRCGTAGLPTLGYIGGRPYTGVDLNGDGDLLDQVTVLAPSQTRTRRYGVIAGLRWDLNDTNTVRVSYTLDNANHRQTGQVGLLYRNGIPLDVFPVNNPVVDANGNTLQKRDRQSYAILNQVSGEYRGEFNDLTVTLGLRAPFFKRDLTQNCFTTSSGGFTDCFSTNAAGNAAYQALRPAIQGPQQRVLRYSDVLPNVGAVYKYGNVSAFGNYAKGLSVPGTDSLYNSFFFAEGSQGAKPKAETTDSFDGGLRYTSGKVQAMVAGWYTLYKNRLASAFDPTADNGTGAVIFRNLGTVEKYGVDGSIAYSPIRNLSVYAFGSVLESRIVDNVQSGANLFDQTAGKREAGSPTYQFGGSARGIVGPVELGVTAKRTGPRYVNDENLPLVVSGVQVFGAKAPAYTLVNLDARLSLADYGLEKTYLQFNVYNLFDTFYVGGFGGAGNARSIPFVQIGAPRTVSGTLVVGF